MTAPGFEREPSRRAGPLVQGFAADGFLVDGADLSRRCC